MEVFRTNRLEIAYERAGHGPPVFLVHGAAGGASLWGPQLEGLADEFTVVCWDEPGAGKSSGLPEGFGLADYAGALAALIEHVDLGPGHVAGLSWGGVVVLALYQARPDLVATLILADTYAGWKGSLPEEEVHARVAGVRQMLSAPAKDFDPSFPGLFGAAPPAEAVDLVERVAAGARPATLRVQVELLARTDQMDILPSIAVPTLLIWGEEDARSPLTVARQFEESIPGSELVVIRGAGHVSNLEQPERFGRAMREFCRLHSRSRSPRP